MIEGHTPCLGTGWLTDRTRCDCNPAPAPWIVAAANSYSDGFVAVGARHWDEVMRIQILAARVSGYAKDGEVQGFIDKNRKFHSRKEAWKIAAANGQIKRVTGSPGTLYSEDLY